MPAATNARVTSIDALDDFRAKLLVYCARARRLLDDVNDDVVRTRVWLQSDRLPYWKKQVWLKQKELAIADQELMTARLSDMPEATQARRMAVNKCKAALREAEERFFRSAPDPVEPVPTSPNADSQSPSTSPTSTR